MPEAEFAKIPDDVKRRVAAHEAGHAIAAIVDEPDATLEATIVPRSGGSAGHVSLRPAPDQTQEPPTRGSLRARLRVLLAGREAEAIAFGDDRVSVMAESDVRRQGRTRVLHLYFNSSL